MKNAKNDHPQGGQSGKKVTPKRYHALTDQALRGLTNQGHSYAQKAILDREWIRKLALFSESFPPSHTLPVRQIESEFSRGLPFRFVKEAHKPVRFFVEIDEWATIDEIKKHWSEIQALRHLLLDLQGPISGHDAGLYQQMHILHRYQRVSYARLAAWLNHVLEDAILESVEHSRQFPEADRAGKLKNWNDHMDWEIAYAHKRRSGLKGWSDVYSLLFSMGLSREEAHAVCNTALGQLTRQMKPHWATGPKPYEEPITKDRVIARLKGWRNRNKEWIKKFGKQRLQAMRGS